MFSLEEEAKREEDDKKKQLENKTEPQSTKKKLHGGIIRLMNDFETLYAPENMKAIPPTKENQEKFYIEVVPQKDLSLWYGGVYRFSGVIDSEYPIKGPKMFCETQIYHPNIDLDGNVCLNILRNDWRPIYTISTILFGLNELFNYPNPNDPLNRDAGFQMRDNYDTFVQNVKKTLKGGTHFGKYFQKFT